MFQTDFTIGELKARREALRAALGDAVAVIQGAAAPQGAIGFRQYNTFYYF